MRCVLSTLPGDGDTAPARRPVLLELDIPFANAPIDSNHSIDSRDSTSRSGRLNHVWEVGYHHAVDEELQKGNRVAAEASNETQRQLVRAKDSLAELADTLQVARKSYDASPNPTDGHLINALLKAVTAVSATLMALNELAYRVDGIEQATGIEVVP